MTDQFDKAQELEEQHRQIALANRPVHQVEAPDEDEDGNRYCLTCGAFISKQRLDAQPNAVRCVFCQSLKERR